MADGDPKADLTTNINLCAESTKDGLIVAGGDDCKEGFKKALDNCESPNHHHLLFMDQHVHETRY